MGGVAALTWLMVVSAVAEDAPAPTSPPSETRAVIPRPTLEETQAVAPGQAAHPAGPTTELPVIDVDVRNESTVGNVVEALKKKYPMYGIVLAPDVKGVRIADMTLRSANLGQLAQAIQICSGQQVTASADRNSLYITQNRQPQPVGLVPGTKTDMRQVAAYNIRQHLDPLEEVGIDRYVSGLQDQILASLSSIKGVKELKDEDRPDFQFFSEGGVFIVIGKQEALEVAVRIISALSPPQPRVVVKQKPDTLEGR
jgi:hypothetical protein